MFVHLRPDSEMTEYSGMHSTEGAETCRRNKGHAEQARGLVPSTRILSNYQVRIKNGKEMKKIELI